MASPAPPPPPPLPEFIQNTCAGGPYPKWPKAITTFDRGVLDKPAQPDVAPEVWNAYEKPFIRTIPDPRVIPFMPGTNQHPIQDGSQTPLDLGAGTPIPVPPVFRTGGGASLPPAPAKKKAVAPPKLPADLLPPSSCACEFSDPQFKISNIPACMVQSASDFFYYLFHTKELPDPKFQNLFMAKNRLFYLLIWLILIIIFAYVLVRLFKL